MVYVCQKYNLATEGVKLFLEIHNFLRAVKNTETSLVPPLPIGNDIGKQILRHATTLEKRHEGTAQHTPTDRKRKNEGTDPRGEASKKTKDQRRTDQALKDLPAQYSTPASKSNKVVSVWDTESATIAGFGYEVRQRNPTVGLSLQVSSSNKPS